MWHSHRRLNCSDNNDKIFPCFPWLKPKCPPPDPRMCDDLQRRGLPRTAEDCRWHYWSHRNDVVIQQLAKLLEGCPMKVAGFLFDLTLQNYNRLLHPKRCGYNACHVPHCHPYMCERYMGIFDENGNLKNPTHPRSMFKLLEILQNFLKGETSGCVSLPFDSILKKGKRTPIIGYQILRPMIAERCYGMSPNANAKKANGPGAQSKDIRTDRPKIEKNQKTGKKTNEPIERLEQQESNGQFKGHVQMLMQQRYKVPGGKEMDDVSIDSQGLMDEKGRRRGMGSHCNHLGTLRSEQAKHLRFLIKDLNEKRGLDNDPQKVITALGQVDLKQDKKHVNYEKSRRNETFAELSKFYATTVSDETEKVEPPAAPRRPRKYYGDTMPVLYHEPFDSKKEWTWIRRHPSQNRLLPDGQVGFAEIKRYRRESIQKAIEKERVRWSIHSTFSLPNSPARARSSINSMLRGVPKKPKK